jgi:hypothetical protein
MYMLAFVLVCFCVCVSSASPAMEIMEAKSRPHSCAFHKFPLGNKLTTQHHQPRNRYEVVDRGTSDQLTCSKSLVTSLESARQAAQDGLAEVRNSFNGSGFRVQGLGFKV